MIIHDMPQGSDEWIAARLGKLTASNFAAVKGSGSGRTTYMDKLIGERMSGVRCGSDFSNKNMEWGIKIEGEAREYYECLYGEVKQVGFVELNEFVGCSPDGLVGDDGLIEIKCPLPSTHCRYIRKNTLPSAYRWQVQGQLWVTGRKWCDFVSFDPRVKNQKMWKIRVQRDEKDIKILSVAADVFISDMKRELAKIETSSPNF